MEGKAKSIFEILMALGPVFGFDEYSRNGDRSLVA